MGRQQRPGYWCLHCERAWHGAGLDGDWALQCPDEACDGGGDDMFPIKGDFEHGEAVMGYSERFDELRTPLADAVELERRRRAADCKVCSDRGFVWVGGAPHELEFGIADGKVHIRSCGSCALVYYAVPLQLWADTVRDSGA